jgi:hypothetical protein
VPGSGWWHIVDRVSSLGSERTIFVPFIRLLFIGVLLCPIKFSAQFNPLDFERIDGQEHFMKGPVSSLVFDEHGFLWVATSLGLYRFDGRLYREYLPSTGLRSLPDQQIREVQHIDGRIIALTRNGTFFHDAARAQDTTIFLTRSDGRHLGLVNRMTAVCSDGHGGFILLSRSGMLHVGQKYERIFQFFYPDPNEADSIAGSWGRDIFPMPDGCFAISGNDGFFMYDPRERAVLPIPAKRYAPLDPFLKDNSANILRLDSGHYILLSKKQRKMVMLKPDFSPSPACTLNDSSYQWMRYDTKVFADRDGGYFFATPGRGIWPASIDTISGKIELAPSPSRAVQPISIVQDPGSGRWWYGMHHGLYKQRDLEYGVRKSAPAFDDALPNNTHVQFAVIGPYLVSGSIEGQTVYVYNASSLMLERSIPLEHYPTGQNILHFTPYGQDSLLICTSQSRYWLDLSSWTVDHTAPRKEKVTSWYSCVAPDGTLFVTSGSYQYEYYDTTRKKFIPVPIRDKERWAQMRQPTQMLAEGGDHLWFWHHGICRYSQQDSIFDQCVDRLEGMHLDQQNIHHAHFDSLTGTLWLTIFQNGILNYNPETGVTRHITADNGLPHHTIQGMAVVGRYLWLLTPMGLFSLSMDQFQVRTYPYGRGAHLTFSRKALTYDPALDQLIFLHDQHIMACDPDRLLRHTPELHLSIEEVKSGSKRWYRPANDPLRLASNERAVWIQLACINYDDVLPYHFEYRLSDQDTTWWQMDESGSIWIENIPQGRNEVQFRIKGQDSRLHYPMTSLWIVAPPRWYETLWIRVAMLLAGAFIIWAMVREYFKRKEKGLRLEHRMKELELEALRARMNPHFIFNCLNSINRYILIEDKSKASYYLSRFARLIRQILDYSSESSVILTDEIETVRLYIELESLRMNKAIKLEIEITPEVDPGNLRVPPLLFQPFVENAIWHGLMPGEAEPHLWIRTFKTPTGYCFEIEDNGIGRAKAAKRQHAKQHISKGLVLAEEAFRHFGRLHHFTTEMRIIDLPSPARNHTGTLVQLEMIISGS